MFQLTYIHDFLKNFQSSLFEELMHENNDFIATFLCQIPLHKFPITCEYLQTTLDESTRYCECHIRKKLYLNIESAVQFFKFFIEAILFNFAYVVHVYDLQ